MEVGTQGPGAMALGQLCGAGLRSFGVAWFAVWEAWLGSAWSVFVKACAAEPKSEGVLCCVPLSSDILRWFEGETTPSNLSPQKASLFVWNNNTVCKRSAALGTEQALD